MYLIKFGGSVITEKSNEKAVFKKSLMHDLSKSLSSAGKQYLIVHGAGSFGHVLAKKYQLNQGFHDNTQRIGFGLTQTKVQELNMYVLQSLQKQGLPAVSLPPHATFTFDNHTVFDFKEDMYKQYLLGGYVPVTYGDVIFDRSQGFSICSGDTLILLLAAKFQPEKVIFIIDEDGLYEDNPKKNPDAKLITLATSETLQKITTKQDDHADVTGGMQGKIDTILQITKQNIDVMLLNGNKPDRLYDALVENETTSTLIKR